MINNKTTIDNDQVGAIRKYIAIARPDHWFKNIFMLPGIALALIMSGIQLDQAVGINIVVAIISTCLIASANYTINEWLDAAFDKHHPVKCNRPSVSGNLKAAWVYSQWLLLSISGLLIAGTLGRYFLIYSAALLVMGLLYNVKPFRAKDRIYMDVLSESVNNPLRFMLGWTAVVSNSIPPSSILMAYWMGGAFLMAIKRYSEYRFIGDPKRAGRYRLSFQVYTEKTLLLSSFFYALMAAFFFGIFLIKYKIEFLLTVPFFALLFVWYMAIGMREDAVTQRPEKLYREKYFMAYLVLLVVVIVGAFIVDLPWLDVFVNTQVLGE